MALMKRCRINCCQPPDPRVHLAWQSGLQVFISGTKMLVGLLVVQTTTLSSVRLEHLSHTTQALPGGVDMISCTGSYLLFISRDDRNHFFIPFWAHVDLKLLPAAILTKE